MVIAKLHTSGLNYQSLKTIYFDLSEAVQVARVGSSHGQILPINPFYVTDLSVSPGNTVFQRVYKRTRGIEWLQFNIRSTNFHHQYNNSEQKLG